MTTKKRILYFIYTKHYFSSVQTFSVYILHSVTTVVWLKPEFDPIKSDWAWPWHGKKVK